MRQLFWYVRVLQDSHKRAALWDGPYDAAIRLRDLTTRH